MLEMRIPFSLLLLMILALPADAASAGQNATKRKTREGSAASSVRSKTRARKAVTPATVSQPAATDKATTPAETPVVETAKQPTDDTTDNKSAAVSQLPPDDAASGTTVAKDAQVSVSESAKAEENDRNRLRRQLEQAEQLAAANLKTEAVESLRAAINLDLFDPQGFYNAGNALVRLGAPDEALKAYRKAIDQRKGNYSRALNNMGVVLLRQGRWDDAYDALLSAIKLENFHYAEGSYNLGRLYAARGETDRAVREWRRALTIDPAHTSARLALASAQIENDGDSAQPGIVNASRTKPDQNKNSASATGTTSSERKPIVLTLDRENYDLLQRARTLSDSGKLLEANEFYSRLIARQGGYLPPANLERGYLLLKLRRNDEALASLLAVMNRHGNRYPVSYYQVARLYELKGDLALAEATYISASKAFKAENPLALMEISRLRRKRGDLKGALAALEEYVRLMDEKGMRPSWADQALSDLRRKTGG